MRKYIHIWKCIQKGTSAPIGAWKCNFPPFFENMADWLTNKLWTNRPTDRPGKWHFQREFGITFFSCMTCSSICSPNVVKDPSVNLWSSFPMVTCTRPWEQKRYKQLLYALKRWDSNFSQFNYTHIVQQYQTFLSLLSHILDLCISVKSARWKSFSFMSFIFRYKSKAKVRHYLTHTHTFILPCDKPFAFQSK